MIDLRDQGFDIQPDAVSFTALIHALGKARFDPKKAASIVAWMEIQRDQGNPKIAPTVATYNALIHVWATSGRNDAGGEALHILERMKNVPGCHPSKKTYNSVIAAIARSGSSMTDQAVSLLHEMESTDDTSLQPDIVTFNSVLNCLARNADHNIALAEKIFADLRSGHKGIYPNTITYNTMMKILARRIDDDSAEKVEELLDELESARKKGVEPTVISFGTCISCWARSRDPERLVRAKKVLERLKEAYTGGNTACKPSTTVYNAILKCCDKLRGYQEATLQIVVEVLDEIQSGSIKADKMTYVLVLRAMRNIQAHPTDAVLHRIAKACAADNKVNAIFLSELRPLAPALFVAMTKGT
mmetsp:Transcript_15355/g.35302  ORF Transcript_15355/g.35302 Transcript_15355/m.35302 type:complete len:359 (-) Transcript_15355:124-1200(-)